MFLFELVPFLGALFFNRNPQNQAFEHNLCEWGKAACRPKSRLAQTNAFVVKYGTLNMWVSLWLWLNFQTTPKGFASKYENTKLGIFKFSQSAQRLMKYVFVSKLEGAPKGVVFPFPPFSTIKQNFKPHTHPPGFSFCLFRGARLNAAWILRSRAHTHNHLWGWQSIALSDLLRMSAACCLSPPPSVMLCSGQCPSLRGTHKNGSQKACGLTVFWVMAPGP